MPATCPIEIVTCPCYERIVSDRHPLPDEIVLSRDEAREVLFALDEAIEAVSAGELRDRLEGAALVIVEKFLPDLPEL